MAMIKIIDPGSWDFGDAPVSQVKVASDGLHGNDLKDFVKRAGHYLADEFKKIKFNPGEVPIHMIALGSTEYYNVNRNGDGFKEASCIKYHPTFEKFARFYRDHNNKDPRKSFGVVKKAFYNPDMHRVELIVGLNSTKEAADKNGGLVADKEMDKLESGRDLGVSMSCKVAHDTCSWCGNKAKTRREYCTESSCEAGGLKNHIGEILKCGHILHADNPEPIFFDISHVVRPADRTAYVTGVLGKEASGLTYKKIDEIFENQAAAWIPSSFNETGITKLARSLSLLESQFDPNVLAVVFGHEQARIEIPAHIKAADALSALAAKGAILPVESFLDLFGVPHEKIASVTPLVKESLSNVYGRLAESSELEKYLSNFSWKKITSGASREWAAKYAMDYGVTDSVINRRLNRGILSGKCVKTASPLTKVAATDSHLASIYAAYTLKALDQIEQTFPDTRLTRKAVLTQNYVC